MTQRTFTSDFRESNPGLHKMCVGWALETLRACDSFIEEMSSHSRVTSSIIVGKVQEQLREEILRDAAYFEAAALIKAHADTTEFDVAACASPADEATSTLADPAEGKVEVPSFAELLSKILGEGGGLDDLVGKQFSQKIGPIGGGKAEDPKVDELHDWLDGLFSPKTPTLAEFLRQVLTGKIEGMVIMSLDGQARRFKIVPETEA